VFVQKKADQVGYVFFSFREWLQVDSRYIQPEEQV